MRSTSAVSWDQSLGCRCLFELNHYYEVGQNRAPNLKIVKESLLEFKHICCSLSVVLLFLTISYEEKCKWRLKRKKRFLLRKQILIFLYRFLRFKKFSTISFESITKIDRIFISRVDLYSFADMKNISQKNSFSLLWIFVIFTTNRHKTVLH